MLRLAAPLALTELGWLAMSFTDTVMVGRLPDSATAIGAVSLGSTLFYTIGIFGSGIMLGMDTLVAQAYGAGRVEECHSTMWNALYLACIFSPILMASLLVFLPLFSHFGLAPALVSATIPFLKALVWSTLPLALYFALRRYLQAMHIVKPVVFALISANLVNLAGNWALVYGHLGARAFGVAGSGWSTCISRAYMVVVLAVAAAYYDRKRSSGLWSASRRLELDRIRSAVAAGIAGGGAAFIGSRRFCHGDFSHRQTGRRAACRTPDCSQCRQLYLYGPSGHLLRRSRAGGPCHGRTGMRTLPHGPDGWRFFLARFLCRAQGWPCSYSPGRLRACTHPNPMW